MTEPSDSSSNGALKWLLGIFVGMILIWGIFFNDSPAESNDSNSNRAAPTRVAPKATSKPSTNSNASCNPNYSPCVRNVSYDLDCGDIGYSVRVIGSDPYRLDRDGDGFGCESY